jgi:hypothetical protein
VQRPAASITYYHIELARHSVILAENLPTETYLDTGGRAAFENATFTTLHPDFHPNVGEIWHTKACAPLIGTEAQLKRVRARLAIQALMLGHDPTRIAA